MSRIVRVDVGQFHYDVVGAFKFLKPDRDGRTRRHSILVRITDDEGNEGYGQAVPIPTWTYETTETVETTLKNYLAPALIGLDPTDVPHIHRVMNTVIPPAFSVGQPLCKAAVDIACFDLWGKKTGESVRDLLNQTSPRRGPLRDELTISWTVGADDLETVERQLEEGRRLGYTNFNVKVGSPQSPEYDVALVRRVRDFAPDGFLWCDANIGYTLDIALEVVPKLADAGANVLESPLPPNRIGDYRALRRQGALPILMDEGLLSPVEAEEFADLEMCDGFALKPARNAGIWPSAAIVDIAHRRGLMVVGSGLTDPDFSLAAALQLYAWAGIEHPCALNGPQYLDTADAGGLFRPVSGVTVLPDEAGLGVPIRDEMIRALTWTHVAS